MDVGRLLGPIGFALPPSSDGWMNPPPRHFINIFLPLPPPCLIHLQASPALGLLCTGDVYHRADRLLF